jgi:hypothetical protein
VLIYPQKDNHFLHNGLDADDLQDNRWWDAYHRAENERMWQQEAKAKTFKRILMTEAEKEELADWRTRLRIRKGGIREGTASHSEMSDYAQFLEANSSSILGEDAGPSGSRRGKLQKESQHKRKGIKGFSRNVFLVNFKRNPFKKPKPKTRDEDLEFKYNPFMDKGWDGAELDDYPEETLVEGCGVRILNDYDPNYFDRYVDGGWNWEALVDTQGELRL